LYLEDDFTREARFPVPITGTFDTTFWEDRLALQVMGEGVNQGQEENCLPTPQDFGLSTNKALRPGTSTTQQPSRSSARTSFAAKNTKTGFQRVVFMADYDSDYQLIKSHTAHLKLSKETCNVHDVAKLTKEYLNLEDDITIVDSHGYEIMDTASTRGELTVLELLNWFR